LKSFQQIDQSGQFTLYVSDERRGDLILFGPEPFVQETATRLGLQGEEVLAGGLQAHYDEELFHEGGGTVLEVHAHSDPTT
jgi:hypothetical protein